MGRTRLRVVGACLAIVGAAAIVSVGGAGNRDAVVTFDAVPGPAKVTSGQALSYTSTFKYAGRNTATHLEFHMTVPTVTIDSTTSPATLVAASCSATIKNGELVCGFDQVKGGSQPVQATVVWQSPQIESSCEACLTTTGFWRIKERDNDDNGHRRDDDKGHGQDDENDTFPAGGITVTATLLADDDPNKAGSFETGACADPLGEGSLSTDPNVDAANPVSTTFCLPTFATSPTALGVAATIDEGPAVSGDPGHPALGRSVVCIAGLGQACGAEGSYTPFDFGTVNPVRFVFRISAAALAKGDKITKVFHNGVALPKCPSTNANGCVVSITPPTTKSSYSKHGGPPPTNKGIWTIVATAPTNGSWTW